MASQYRIHTIGAGDTIQAIADLYGVNWTELVVINGLEYPYIDDSLYINENLDNDNVGKIGSKILIPTIGLKVPNKTNLSSEEIEKYAFGRDLDLYSLEESLNHTVNLESEGILIDNGMGDIKLAEGLYNLRQQLISRLGTPKGALLLHPEYGSNILKYIGKKTTQEVLIDVNLEVCECLLEDFRVEGVSDVDCTFANQSIRVNCVIHPIEPYSSPFLLDHIYTQQ